MHQNNSLNNYKNTNKKNNQRKTKILWLLVLVNARILFQIQKRKQIINQITAKEANSTYWGQLEPNTCPWHIDFYIPRRTTTWSSWSLSSGYRSLLVKDASKNLWKMTKKILAHHFRERHHHLRVFLRNKQLSTHWWPFTLSKSSFWTVKMFIQHTIHKAIICFEY